MGVCGEGGVNEVTENLGVCDLGDAEKRLLPGGRGRSCQVLLRGRGRGGPGIAVAWRRLGHRSS